MNNGLILLYTMQLTNDPSELFCLLARVYVVFPWCLVCISSCNYYWVL